jgi:hypothetical protein
LTSCCSNSSLYMLQRKKLISFFCDTSIE